MDLTKRTALTALALVAAAACSDGIGPAFDDAGLNEDLAAVAAVAALDDVQSMVLETDGGSAVSGAPAAMTGFGPHGGLAPNDVMTRTFSRTFFDVDGLEMDGFDRLLTASVEMVWTVSGTVTRDIWSGSVERSRTTVLSGLEGEETTRTWNGTGSDIVSRSQFRPTTDEQRTYDLTASTVITDVVVGVPRSENPYPLSGSISYDMVVTITTPDGTRTRERTATIVFDGTQFATLTVNGEVFEVDLDDRQGRHPRRR